MAIQYSVLPHYLSLGNRVADGWWYRAVSWTSLAPLTLARLATSAARTSDGVAGGGLVSFVAAVLCPVLAVTACFSLARVMARGQKRRAYALLAALALCSVVSSAGLAMQCRGLVLAERTFVSLASREGWGSREPAEDAVQAARRFLAAFPSSRWASEAWRVIATGAAARGQHQAAADAWQHFEECFRDPSAPGVAYAEFSRGWCEEQLGHTDAAVRCYGRAIRVIRVRGDGVQSWIAVESARRLATLERSNGMLATAQYWSRSAQAFARDYTIQ